MKRRIICPVIVHCMYIEESISPVTEDKEFSNSNMSNSNSNSNSIGVGVGMGGNEEDEEPIALSRPASHLTNDGLYLRKMNSAHTSSSTFAAIPLVSDELPPPESVDDSHLIVAWPSVLRHSDYLPFHMGRVDSPTIEREEAWTSSGEGMYHLLPKSDSITSAYTLSRVGGGRELLEKCLPLMRDHYCVDEMCYKLSISHDVFWKMVQEFPSQFFMYYIIPN